MSPELHRRHQQNEQQRFEPFMPSDASASHLHVRCAEQASTYGRLAMRIKSR
jgi:hypothetical protein